MKKRKIILSTILAGGLLVSSCSEDFLNKQPTAADQLTSEQLAEAGEYNPDLIKGTVTGIYSYMIEPQDDHNDFGQKGFDIMSDMLSGDMALTANNYNWYMRLVDFQATVDYTRSENLKPWKYYYTVIRSANSVIATLGGNDSTPETEENKWLMGQVKALRAYAYFYLTQFYTREYNPSQEILPIYTEVGQPAQPKSLSSDVYGLIVSDLSEAIVLLENFTRTQKSEIDVNVARGLLAYTYGAMGDYGMVKTLTGDVINSGAFPLTTSAQVCYPGVGSGFNDVSTASWMWGVNLEESLGINLISWWGQMDYFTYSYQWAGDRKAIDATLYASIPTNDVRKNQFPSSSPYFNMPVNKFFDPGRTAGQQRYISTDYIYMRVDEMYLLNAEASAKTGDEGTARTRLHEFLANRIPDHSYVDGLTGQALLDEIYKQTRVEFWGEGKSYLAMKRNHATITRGANHLFQAGVSVPYNDTRLTFLIPQQEMNFNPYITEQN